MIKNELLTILQKSGWIEITNKGYMLTVDGIENYIAWIKLTRNKFELPNQVSKQFVKIDDKKIHYIKNNLISNKLVCTVWDIKKGTETMESTSFGYDLFQTMAFYTHPTKIRNAKIKTELKNGFNGLLKAISSMQNTQQSTNGVRKDSKKYSKSRKNTSKKINSENDNNDFFDYSSISNDFKKWGKL